MSVPRYYKSAILDNCPGVRHGFFSRQGGISLGDFDSLNCGYLSGDNLDCVSENRNRVCLALGSQSIISLKQIHSDRVHVVDGSWIGNQVVDGDGMVTVDSDIALGVLGADCAPVLFSDSVNQIVGAAHAGWKGAVLGVTDKVVETMCSLGSDPGNISVAVGPAIQLDSYEVGAEFYENFSSLSSIQCRDFFDFRNHTIYFNLPAYILKKLECAGIKTRESLGMDTYVNETEFYSYRRMCHRNEKQYGRQIGAITMARPE
jgi:YfiH family protein